MILRAIHKYVNMMLLLFICSIVFLSGIDQAGAMSATVTGSVVNIRSGPGSDYEITGTVYQDTEVVILDQKGEWYQVKIGSVTGWIHNSLLQMDQEVLLTVTGEQVNLRTGPGTSYQVAAQASRGDVLTLLDVEGEWYKVKTSDGVTCYVASFLAEGANRPGSEDTATVSGKIQAADGTVNVRSGPATSYDKIGTMAESEVYPVYGKEGDWYKIRLQNGQYGYAAAWLVSLTGASNVQPAAPATTSAGQGNAPVVYLDNKKLSFDVPPIISNDRTLVPLRAIFEAMGAAVEWESSTQTVTARKNDIVVVLSIGSTKPVVNGLEWPLDVPAQIVQDRTLAPLRFVGEAFGGQVSWDGATRTVNITSPPGSTSGTSSNSSNTTVPALVKVGEGVVNLRSGPGTTYTKITEIGAGETLPVVAAADGWYQVSRGGSTAWVASWVVDVAWEPDEPSDTPAPVDGAPSSTPSAPAQLAPEECVWFSSSRDEEGLKIIMESGSRLSKKVTEDKNTVTYTFYAKQLRDSSPLTAAIGAQSLVVKGENQGSNAVVTIQIPEGITYQTYSEYREAREVLLIPNRIVRVGRKVVGDTGENIILYTLGTCEPDYTLKGDTIEVSLPGVLKGNERELYEYKVSPVLEKMTVKQIDGDDPETRLIIETKNLGDYNVFWTQDDNALNIVLSTEKESAEIRENLVVLDPGHGGSEPGAICGSFKEKDVNLDIALRVGKILEARGIEVAYTRKTDCYVSRPDRCEIANRLNAAAFVSIHNNSSDSSDPNGTESYYYAPLDNAELFMQKDQRSSLANYLQEELVDHLDRKNRGVKQAAFTVLVQTEMPSALVEIAFMSNAEEQQLLTKSSFKDQAAKAIADGIERYMLSISKK